MHDAVGCGHDSKIDTALLDALADAIARLPQTSGNGAGPNTAWRPRGTGSLDLFIDEFHDELERVERSLVVCQRWAREFVCRLLARLDVIRVIVGEQDKRFDLLHEVLAAVSAFYADVSDELNVSERNAFGIPIESAECEAECTKRLAVVGARAERLRRALETLMITWPPGREWLTTMGFHSLSGGTSFAGDDAPDDPAS